MQRVKSVAEKLKGVAKVTELERSTTFSCMAGCQVYLKAENLQKTGSFKIRGAYNKISSLSPEEKERGVVAASAGNHAQGVAYAASEQGIDSLIVMPERTPIAKITATENYGARVVLHGEDYDEAYQEARRQQEETGGVFVHAFDDIQIITGQATVGWEIMRQLPQVDTILAPVGGGGLISGISLVAKKMNPQVRVVGVEVRGAASMGPSWEKGEVVALDSVCTIADGIAVKKPAPLTLEFCRRHVDAMVVVEEEEVANAILLLLERAKMTVEGAGAVTLAALLNGQVSVSEEEKAVAVLSGGNIDMNVISRIIERGLTKAGRRITFSTVVEDRPGRLQKLLRLLADLDANVISVNHDRTRPTISVSDTLVELRLEVRDQEHGRRIYDNLREQGYRVNVGT